MATGNNGEPCQYPLVLSFESHSPTASSTDTFNNFPNRKTSPFRYASNASATPFHIHNIDGIDVNPQNTNFLHSELPTNLNNAAHHPVSSSVFTFFDATEMEFPEHRTTGQASPATQTSQSRGGSTSQSSYSPGGGPRPSIPIHASPKLSHPQESVISGATMCEGLTATTTTHGLFANSVATSGDNEAPYQQGFLADNEWALTAMSEATGLTPGADNTWDSLLEGVTMGWDGVGPLPDGGGVIR